MAATTTPLVWDFYRETGLEYAEGLGAVLHYYDRQSQSIWLNNGIKTRTAEIVNGQWETAAQSDYHTISSVEYDHLEIDHASNGLWYGAAIEGDNLYLLRYLYAKDLSDFTVQATWQEQVDNEIKQMTADIANVDYSMFANENTLFNPGARLQLHLTAGDSSPYIIGTAYIDDIEFDAYSDTISVSGRNAIGVLLSEQIFGTDNSFTGYSHEIFKAILDLAGIMDYEIQIGTGTKPYTFEYDATLYDGLSKMFEYYYTWRLSETPDGKIIIGNSETFIPIYVQNGYYEFDAGSEVFTRKTTKNSDAAYTHVLVKCADTKTETVDETEVVSELYPPVLVAVPHYSFWAVGQHKIYFCEGAKGMTEQEMTEYAQCIANELQYTGISETFTSPIRPWLIVGDVAAIHNPEQSGTSINLGLITSVKHTLGQKGFATEFTVDSGGAVTDGESYTITSNAALGGYNRKPTIVDMILKAVAKIRTIKNKVED